MRTKRDVEIAKAGYKEALERGDREEQARWANQVGHACKERGQYVEALKWFRLDYDISSKRKSMDASNQGFLMPTCQSLGEIYYRLNDYEEALIFQKRHFQLAEESDNLVEQQRASTQLGRTYLEMYEQKDEFSALENAKQFFKISMDIARTLKENPPSRDSPSFVKELVDAYNNMGLLMMVIDDHKQAISYFEQGLRICNEEELREDDDARSRLHHNLGRIYNERRDWEKAKHHTQTDISICQRIPHPQGEAKGFINLGEMHFKRQRYEEATRCFERALNVAQSLEDEDDLVSTAQRNLDVVNEAEEKLLKLTVGEQQLKKLQRKRLLETKVKASHRVEEYKLLNELIGLAEYLQFWEKHLKLAKSLKSVVKEMGDMEKLGDAMETVGESYYSLKKFLKAKKWILRGFDLCKRIGHLEGQSVAMINYGNVLDSLEDWEQALKAYKEAFEIARSQGRTKMLSQQINALENLQYCYLVRMKSISDARAIQSKIQGLKELRDKEDGVVAEEEHCSETDSESSNPTSARCDNDRGNLPKQNATSHMHTIVADSSDDGDDVDASPAALTAANNLHSDGNAPRAFVRHSEGVNFCGENECTGEIQVPKAIKTKGLRPEEATRTVNVSNKERRLRKRPRVVHLDKEETLDFVAAADIESETYASAEANKSLSVRVYSDDPISPLGALTGVHAPNNDHEVSEVESGRSGSLSCVPSEVDIMKTASSHSLLEDQRDSFTTNNRKTDTFTFVNKSESAREEALSFIAVQMGNEVIKLNLQKVNKEDANVKTIDWLKREILGTFKFRNPAGLKPLLWHLVLKGRILQPSETLDNALAEYRASDILEANVDCWVPVPLLDRYQEFCQLYQQGINAKLVKSLMESKSLEDKICAFSCSLDDNSAWPLLMALNGNGAFSHLDLSHNFLGSQSVDKIQKLIAASNQPNLGLILDLHNNNLGAVSIAQICECPVTLSRLEVLNLSDNKLTDAAARFIANLIKNSQALEVLKLQNCGLTTRSILKLSAALQSSCPLVRLSIGKNSPMSSAAIAGLLDKLSSLSNFLELDLTGTILDKEGAEAVARLLKSSKLVVEDVSGQIGLAEVPHVMGLCRRTILKLDTSVCNPTWTAQLPAGSCPHCVDTSKRCMSCVDSEQNFQ